MIMIITFEQNCDNAMHKIIIPPSKSVNKS